MFLNTRTDRIGLAPLKARAVLDERYLDLFLFPPEAQFDALMAFAHSDEKSGKTRAGSEI